MKIYSSFTDSAAHLADMTGLKELNLHDVRLPDADIKNVVKIKSLTSLDIAFSFVTDETLAEIATLPSLKKLNLAVCPNVTIKGIENLAPLRLDSIELASLGSVNDKELFELAKETSPDARYLPSITT